MKSISTLMRMFLILLLAVSTLLNAQSTWNLDGQIRYRAEVDNRDFNSNTGLNNFNLLRSRLGATFSGSDSVRGYLQIQDSRRFGEETSTLADGSADNLDVHQAFVEVARFFDLPIDLKIGRMEVVFGSQRLIGAVGWSNIGRSFDGAMLNLHAGQNRLAVFGFQEVESRLLQNSGDRHIFGVNGYINSIPNHDLQPILVWQRSSPSSTINRLTAGFYLKKTSGSLRYEVDAALQNGTVSDNDYQAYMAALSAVYTANHSRKPFFGAGIDYLSGADGDSRRPFDTMYATNHKFYGYMDYFLNIPVHSLGLGLMDINAQIGMKPQANTTLKLIFHQFSGAEETGSGESVFGQEFDLIVQHKYNRQIGILAGWSFFLPGEVFESIGRSDTSNWGFLMMTVGF